MLIKFKFEIPYKFLVVVFYFVMLKFTSQIIMVKSGFNAAL